MDQQQLLRQAEESRIAAGAATSLPRAYYRGDHRIALASKQFTNPFREVIQGICDNQVKLVVDTTSAHMRVEGFEVSDEQGGADVAQVVQQVWERSRLDVTQRQDIFRPEQVDGGVVLLAWTDADGAVRFWVKPIDQVIVKESTESPGKVVYAADFYQREDGQDGVTVYTPDEVRAYARARGGRWQLDGEVQPNPLGVVPVAVLGDRTSDATPLIPLNDMLNKSLMNLVVAGEFYTLSQRVAVGLDVELDDETGEPIAPFKTGPDRVLVVPPNEKDVQPVSIFDLPGQDPSPMLAEQESLRVAISRLSQTPAHLLNQSGSAPSGESLKTAMAPFLEKIADKQAYIGAGLSRVAGYAYQLTVLTLTGVLPAFPIVSVVWEGNTVGEPTAAERAATDKTRADTLAILAAAGVPVNLLLVRVMGWSEDEAAAAAASMIAVEAARFEAQARALDLGQL